MTPNLCPTEAALQPEVRPDTAPPKLLISVSLLSSSWQAQTGRADLLVPAQTYVGQFLMTFKDFPPRQGSQLQPGSGDAEVAAGD
jgi:hypothetical protein